MAERCIKCGKYTKYPWYLYFDSAETKARNSCLCKYTYMEGDNLADITKYSDFCSRCDSRLNTIKTSEDDNYKYYGCEKCGSKWKFHKKDRKKIEPTIGSYPCVFRQDEPDEEKRVGPASDTAQTEGVEVELNVGSNPTHPNMERRNSSATIIPPLNYEVQDLPAPIPNHDQELQSSSTEQMAKSSDTKLGTPDNLQSQCDHSTGETFLTHHNHPTPPPVDDIHNQDYNDKSAGACLPPSSSVAPALLSSQSSSAEQDATSIMEDAKGSNPVSGESLNSHHTKPDETKLGTPDTSQIDAEVKARLVSFIEAVADMKKSEEDKEDVRFSEIETQIMEIQKKLLKEIKQVRQELEIHKKDVEFAHKE